MHLTEQQKNCPYCHYPWEKIPVRGLEEDDESSCYEQYETNGFHRLIKTTNILRDCGFAPWIVFVNDRPKFCEQCGRPLWQEDD